MDPGPILQLATGYWASQALLTANRMGLFASLAASDATAEEIAERFGSRPRSTRLLLEACAALGLLHKAGARYANTDLTTTFLVPGSPAFLGDALRYSDDLYQPWGGLEEAVRRDAPTLPPSEILGDDPGKTRHFVRGMHNRAMGIARGLVEVIDLTGRHRLLDVGGGPGTYSCLLTQRYDGLRATVLDLPAVVEIAREIIAELGAAQRVATAAGDFLTTPWPGDNDALLISGVFHRQSEAECRRLIATACDALVPGGQLIVADVFTTSGARSPFAALFGLNMLVSAPGGGVHSAGDVAQWMSAAGFADVAIHPLPPPMPHIALTARRP
jgi:precorrin-6B methylase 2